MSMFPHTITLYYEAEDPVSFEYFTTITVLKGVLFDATRGSNLRKMGLDNADAVTVYIPHGIEAVDGISLLNKRYVEPKEYEIASDKGELWTIDEKSSFFVKGEVVEANADFQQLNVGFDNVYRVTKVDNKDFGGLKHFEVGGR